jgi:hypothetical protein
MAKHRVGTVRDVTPALGGCGRNHPTCHSEPVVWAKNLHGLLKGAVLRCRISSKARGDKCTGRAGLEGYRRDGQGEI